MEEKILFYAAECGESAMVIIALNGGADVKWRNNDRVCDLPTTIITAKFLSYEEEYLCMYVYVHTCTCSLYVFLFCGIYPIVYTFNER